MKSMYFMHKMKSKINANNAKFHRICVNVLKNAAFYRSFLIYCFSFFETYDIFIYF